MRNVDAKIDGKMLTIVIDLGKDLGPSSTGKTRLVASTDGAQTIAEMPAGMKVNISVFKKQ